MIERRDGSYYHLQVRALTHVMQTWNSNSIIYNKLPLDRVHHAITAAASNAEL